VQIHLDVFAVEQAWKLVDVETGIAIRDYPYETFQYGNYIQEQKIQLEVGRTYDFTIYDQYGDGITNNGYYHLYYSTPTSTDNNDTTNTNGGKEEEEVDLVPATEFTGYEQHHHQFTVPSISTPTSISTSTTRISTTPSSSTMAAFALVSSSQIKASSQGRNGEDPTERLRKKGNPNDRNPP